MNETRQLLLSLSSGQPKYPALDYGVSLAGILGWPVTILGVLKTDSSPRLEEQVEAARQALVESGIPTQVEWDRGAFETALKRSLANHPGSLTLFSDVHKPIWGRFVQVGRFRSLMAAVHSPLLRIQRTCQPPTNLLVCSGGLAYTIPLEKLSIQIAAACSAKITFFHVVEPVTLDYALAREVREHWETLLKTKTPQARHLQSALEAAQRMEVEARVVVRHGPLIHELFTEIRGGSYDLVAVGSAYSSQTLRHLTRPDVAGLLGASFDCPVLTARGKITDTYG